jgi:predicted Rossmann-fold nucleotide-binding protein
MLLIFPGGFAPLNEPMEILELVQTGKIRKKISVVIYGLDYWNGIINFTALIQWEQSAKLI